MPVVPEPYATTLASDWKWHPTQTYTIRRQGFQTLITEFEDGTETRRRKGTANRRVYTEVHHVAYSEASDMMDFFTTKGTDVAFDKLSWDPEDSQETVVEVRFLKPPVVTHIGPDYYKVAAEFIETV